MESRRKTLESLLNPKQYKCIEILTPFCVEECDEVNDDKEIDLYDLSKEEVSTAIKNIKKELELENSRAYFLWERGEKISDDFTIKDILFSVKDDKLLSEVYYDGELTKENSQLLIDFISGQLSDGYGEGIEQGIPLMYRGDIYFRISLCPSNVKDLLKEQIENSFIKKTYYTKLFISKSDEGEEFETFNLSEIDDSLVKNLFDYLFIELKNIKKFDIEVNDNFFVKRVNFYLENDVLKSEIYFKGNDETKEYLEKTLKNYLTEIVDLNCQFIIGKTIYVPSFYKDEVEFVNYNGGK